MLAAGSAAPACPLCTAGAEQRLCACGGWRTLAPARLALFLQVVQRRMLVADMVFKKVHPNGSGSVCRAVRGGASNGEGWGMKILKERAVLDVGRRFGTGHGLTSQESEGRGVAEPEGLMGAEGRRLCARGPAGALHSTAPMQLCGCWHRLKYGCERS